MALRDMDGIQELGFGTRESAFPQKLSDTGPGVERDLNFGFRINLHADPWLQETLNYWKQLPHILKYFRAEEDPNARRPQNFMTGFLEVSLS